MEKSKEELIEEAEKVYFYYSIKNYFENCKFDEDYYITKKIISQFYQSDNDDIKEFNYISFLWDCYMPNEYLYVPYFNCIEHVIQTATF